MLRRIRVIAAISASFCGVSSLPAQAASTATIVSGPAGTRVDSALKTLEAQGMSGVFLIAKGGEVVLQKGYGFANRQAHIAFTPGIVTQIGSCTKDFTAVAILQLAARGELSLDDHLTRWFPAAPDDKRAITVAQLMEHTAGFEEYSGGDFDRVTRDQFVAHMLASKLRSPVGAEEHYSNPGYGLLAVIIEMVSHTSYDEYVRDNILKPLGLTDTGYLLPNFNLARVSHGYEATGDNGTILDKPHATDGPYWNLRGNGGMVSTVGDMYGFYEALFTGEKLVAFTARHGRFPPNQPLGLAGSDGTHFFLYERDPRSGVSYIIATNNADFKGPRVRNPIVQALGLEGGAGRRGTATAASLGPATLPRTAAGAAFAKYMVAFNSGDTTVMANFFASEFAPNPQAPPTMQRLANYRRMFGNLGAIIPLAIDASDDTHITVTTRNKDGEDVAIEIAVEPTGAHRIVSLRITVQ
jgi:CubicO group peptidase (beta-lactamase class C family)